MAGVPCLFSLLSGGITGHKVLLEPVSRWESDGVLIWSCKVAPCPPSFHLALWVCMCVHSYLQAAVHLLRQEELQTACMGVPTAMCDAACVPGSLPCVCA